MWKKDTYAAAEVLQHFSSEATPKFNASVARDLQMATAVLSTEAGLTNRARKPLELYAALTDPDGPTPDVIQVLVIAFLDRVLPLIRVRIEMDAMHTCVSPTPS